MTEATTETMTEPSATAAIASDENFALAVVAGLGAAAVGAIAWAVFVYVTQMELGLVAIALGALVGYAIQKAGHSSDKKFGILGGACAALGWALGMLLCDLAVLAQQTGQPFLDVVARLGLGASVSLAVQSTQAMDLLFLAIAVWEGYKLATRRR